MHRLVSAAAVGAHMVFVGFTIIGGFLAWLAPWVLIPHAAAALWGGRMAVSRAKCPLSRLENWGRVGSGKPTLDPDGFIAHYFENRVYPARWARRVELIVGGLVLGSWLGLALR